MSAALAEVLNHPGIWRGDGFRLSEPDTLPCSHPQLAAALPGGGWPKAGISELITRQAGCGELRLLLPALAQLTQAGKQVMLIAPPHIPYAPAWQAAGVEMARLTWLQTSTEADAQWAMEQALREPACGAVVSWFKHSLSVRQGKRMQLAAEEGGGSGFVIRQGMAEGASPFGLRLAIDSVAGGVSIRILKRRGSPLDRPLFLPHQSSPYAPNAATASAPHVMASPAPARPAARRAAFTA